MARSLMTPFGSVPTSPPRSSAVKIVLFVRVQQLGEMTGCQLSPVTAFVPVPGVTPGVNCTSEKLFAIVAGGVPDVVERYMSNSMLPAPFIWMPFVNGDEVASLPTAVGIPGSGSPRRATSSRAPAVPVMMHDWLFVGVVMTPVPL